MAMDLLLNISVPTISENYDVLVPDFLEIEKLSSLIAKAVEEMSGQRYSASGKEVLCLDGRILHPRFTLKQCAVANGDQIMLF